MGYQNIFIVPKMAHSIDIKKTIPTIQRDNRFYLRIQNSIMGTYYANPMRTKVQTFHIFSKFICQAKLLSAKKLKYFYIDFGRKFTNQAFEEYTFKKSIKSELNTSYIP